MLYTVRNSIFPSNTYILTNSANSECIIIDPGLDEKAIEEKIVELRVRPTEILATHGHFDHVGSATYFKKKYNATLYVHKADTRLLQSVNFFLKMMKIDLQVETPVPDQLLDGEKSLALKNASVEIFNFPGHTPGSCLFLIDSWLFTGDILYAEGVGYNPFPGQDKKSLQHSVKAIFDMFDDDLTIYPGHGRSARLREIKQNNLELKNFLEVDY